MTKTWKIQQCDRELANGGITTANWRVNAEQTVGTGDDAVTYYATRYGTCRFTPDPESGDYTPYADVTEADVLGWCWVEGVDQTEIEASLQAAIDLEITPANATGVPW